MKIYYVVFSNNVAISNRPLRQPSPFHSSWEWSLDRGTENLSIGLLRDPDEYQYFLRLSGGRIKEQLELEL